MGAMAAAHRREAQAGAKRAPPYPGAADIFGSARLGAAASAAAAGLPHGSRAASSRRGGKTRTAPAAAARARFPAPSVPSVRTPRKAVHRALERIADRGMRRGRLVAAMGHAVGAFLVAPGAVGIPVGRLHQFLEGLGVAFAEQIAGLLPAEQIARRHSPGRAVVFPVAGEEIEEQAASASSSTSCPCPERRRGGTVPWSCGG